MEELIRSLLIMAMHERWVCQELVWHPQKNFSAVLN